MTAPLLSQQQLQAIRRELHRHAESGCSEFWTTAFIAEQLTQAGYTVSLGEAIHDRDSLLGVPPLDVQESRLRCALEQGANPAWIQRMQGLTGLVADLRPDLPHHVALRFDIDAVDVNESTTETHLPCAMGFASLNTGVHHACAHDGHATIGLGVAFSLARYKNSLQHNIRLIFEPGEEGCRGALPMVKAGVVQGVRYFLAAHIGVNAAESRSLVCGSYGFFATTKFDVLFQGLAAHAGASPHLGKNSLLAAASATLNLHAIPRHGDGESRISVGMLHAGSGRNTIPAQATLCCETRGETTEINDFMFERAQKIITSTALMYDQSVSLILMGGSESAASDSLVMDIVQKAAVEIPYFLPERIRREAHAFGSDDVCTFMRAVQKQGGFASYAMLGSALPAGHHNPLFDFEESLLQPSVELFTQAALTMDSLR